MKKLEHLAQVALFRWAELNVRMYPSVNLMFAIPNGGQRHPAVAASLKAEGVKAGVPDVCLPVSRGKWIGLWIEIKAGRNKPTPSQIRWHRALEAEGHLVKVCYGWEAAVEVVKEYLAI